MPSVADQLREDLQTRMQSLSAAERIELALLLGDDDLQMFSRANGLTLEQALQRLGRQRQKGRRLSRCMQSNE